VKLNSFGKSDIGRKRANNEDSFIINPDLDLFVVSDGMGGEAAGEIASTILAETAVEVFSGANNHSTKHAAELIQKVFTSANQKILDHTKYYPHHSGMGCTAEVLTFSDEEYVAGHIGDSRIYHLRNQKLTQITNDHSLVQKQLDLGLISEPEAKKHPLRNILLRALGSNEPFAVDIIKGNVFVGDIFLICSDGLTSMVKDSVLADVLASSLSVNQKVTRLVQIANNAGGFDNITVVVVQVEDSES
jgi:serine/threonine protein phosphatase PrpC